MATQVDFSPPSQAGRRLVRVLFVAWIIYFAVGLIVRKKFGEPYPGFFMPSFAGTGLSRMSATEGETSLCHITVTFQDRTTAQLTPTQFCGEALFPASLVHQILSSRDKELPADTRRYLATRTKSLFPGKKPDFITFSVYRESFALDHPQVTNRVELINQCTVSLSHEGSN